MTGDSDALILERVTTQLVALERRMAHQEEHSEEVRELLFGVDPRAPGLSMRLDRIERALAVFKWLGTGGLVSVFATLLLLYKILQALAE